MLESEAFGDLLFNIDFYLLPKFKLSSFRFNSYLKDFFFWFLLTTI